MTGFQLVASRFGLSRRTAIWLFLPATIAYPLIGFNWLTPWTTTPSAAFIWLALGLACQFGDPSPVRPGMSAALGALLALIPLCRPADIVVSFMIGLCLMKPLMVDARRWRVGMHIGAGAVAMSGAYLALYMAIYGPHPTDYMQLSWAFGDNFRWVGWKAYLLLIEPRPWYPDGKGLLQILPWLPVGVAGMVQALGQRDKRWLMALLGLPAIAYVLVMISYVDLLPSGLWRYGLTHYFKWLFPLLMLFAWEWLRAVRRVPLRAGLILALVMLPTALRIEPEAAGPNEPARLAVFASPSTPFSDVYFSRSVVVDRTGAQMNLLDVHLVPNQAGLVLAEPLRRPFMGDEQWLWPGQDPLNRPGAAFASFQDTPLPGAFPRQDVGRYRPHVTLGWPCWLPPYDCPVSLPPPR